MTGPTGPRRWDAQGLGFGLAFTLIGLSLLAWRHGGLRVGYFVAIVVVSVGTALLVSTFATGARPGPVDGPEPLP